MAIHPACDDLTDRQYAIWLFIRTRIESGRPTTIRTIARGFGISSPNGVVCHLKSLARKGYLIREHGRTGIRLRCREVSIPVFS